MQHPEGLELVGDPGLMTDLLAVDAAFMPGFQHARVGDGVTIFIQVDAALAVELVVLQVAQHARPEDFGSDQAGLDLVSGRAQIDRSLLAGLDLAKDIRDPSLLEETTQRIKQPAFFKTGGFIGEGKRLAGIVLPLNKLLDRLGVQFWLIGARAVNFFELSLVIQIVVIFRKSIHKV
jgi:hypothetical protein